MSDSSAASVSPFAAQDAWRVGDAVRVAGALAVPLAAFVAGGPAAAAMLLALGGLMLLRLPRLAPATEIACQLALLGSAWAATTGAFDAVPGLDALSHALCGAVLAVLTRTLLDAAAVLPEPGSRQAGARAARIVLCTASVVLLGLLWELGEWAGHVLLSPAIGVGYEDTLIDLTADGVGALLAMSWLERRRPQR